MLKQLTCLTLLLLSSCAALDLPLQVVDPDTDVMTTTTLGDAIADNATPIAESVGAIVGSFNPVLGLLVAGAIGTLLAGARHKKRHPT